MTADDQGLPRHPARRRRQRQRRRQRETVDEPGEDIFRQVLRAASGEHTEREELDCGEEEFVARHPGATR